MTSSLEKVFFNYILNNRKYFELVRPYFFKNSEIQFVYGIIREYMIKNNDAKAPSPKQILDMVTLEDKEGLITKDILKSILQVNLAEYDEKNFIEPKFNAWVLTNRLKKNGAKIDAIYYCPHHPNANLKKYRFVCDCRKPNIGMIKKAARKYGINLEKSFLVGDMTQDILAGNRARLKTILVKKQE